MTEKFASFLGPVDTAFYYVESEVAPMNIGSVSIFEGKVSYPEVLRTVDSRIHRAPIYQQKIVQAPLSLSAPMWVFDPDFDIRKHVFQVQIDPPNDDEALRLTASRLLSNPLDRDKPLWEIHVIEGLSDNRTALFFKIHHCMVDGLAAVELFTLLFDLTPEVAPLEPKPLYNPPEEPTAGEIIVEAFKRDLPHKFNILKKLGDDVGTMFNVFTHKEPRRKALVGIANVVNDNLKPIRKLPINGKNSGRQQLAWAEFSLAEVRGIKSARDASVNDVVLSVLAAAVERYARDQEPDGIQEFLRVLVPVSMRLEQERGSFGNRISVLPVDINFDHKTPLNRLQGVKDYTTMMKESALSNSLDMLLTVPALLPSLAQPLVWSVAPVAFSVLAHTWCTNVAGPQIPVYLRGHKLIRNYGFFPLNPSMGLACVVLSYNQRITMTLVADSAIVPDVRVIRDYLYDCYEELRTAAKVDRIEPIEFSWDKPTTPPQPAAKPAAVLNGVTGDAHPAQAQVPVNVLEVVQNNEDIQEAQSAEDMTPVDDSIAEAIPDAPGLMPVPEAVPTAPAGKPKLFSDAWAKAYQVAINANTDYYNASTKWTAGALAFVMRVSPANGFPQATAVLLDLYKGQCRAAHAITPQEAQDKAAFIIEGDYDNWMKVLSGKAQPLPMIVTGKLKLKKGALTRLMPFTQSAQELIKSAQRI